MLLQVRGLTKRYERRGGSFFAVERACLQMDPGDVVCITGPSGSGKSTLLNMLAGMIPADDGEIVFDGADVCTLSDEARARLRGDRIGYIPQGNSLLQNFSVLDNICLPRYLARSPGKDGGARRGVLADKARELLAKVGMERLESESPRELSGGEARRVAIARSLIADPKMIIADEPTGDLDPQNADEVFRLLGEAAGRGVAVVLVTHDRAFPACANRRLKMEAGRLTEDAPAAR
jgi:putative ABC transport system ATP-binding protein